MAGVAPRTIASPPARQQVGTLVVLVGLAAIGWVVFLVQATGDSMGMDARGDTGVDAMGDGSPTVPDLSMGASAPLFLASWTVMMAAMMLPAASPMVLMYHRAQRSRPLRTMLFTGSYLALWALFGLAAFALAVGVERLAVESSFVARHWARVGGALIMAAGAYQLSPGKAFCLRHCRSPLSFLLTHWRDGWAGAVRMGVEHGLYCAGCCWMLFVVLVPIGVMNVAAMLLVAIVVFAEKALPRPVWSTRLAASGLALYGAAVVASPSLLPTVA